MTALICSSYYRYGKGILSRELEQWGKHLMEICKERGSTIAAGDAATWPCIKAQIGYVMCFVK
jgi:hypothetical protein